MVGCLPILSSCSNRPVEVVYKPEKTYIEPSFLEIDCKEVGAGETVRSLAYGYTMNRGCLRAYVKLIEGIKKMYTKDGVENDTTSTNK